MPSTYTANSGIELPANGEQSSTWGNTVNDNMNIIDRLVNGVGSISLSGTSHTLATLDGTVSDGHYKVLLLAGSPSGTNTVTLTPNSAQHVYIVKNNCGQTATFTQGSGANVSVLNGTSKIIYSDGAGSGAAVVDITTGLDLGFPGSGNSPKLGGNTNGDFFSTKNSSLPFFLLPPNPSQMLPQEFKKSIIKKEEINELVFSICFFIFKERFTKNKEKNSNVNNYIS